MRIDELNTEQIQFLQLLSEGVSLKDASKIIWRHHRTLENWIKKIRIKLKAKNRVHLIANAIRTGLITLFILFPISYGKCQSVVGGTANFDVVSPNGFLDSVYRVRIRLIVDSPYIVPFFIKVSLWDNDTNIKVADRVQGIDDVYWLSWDSSLCYINLPRSHYLVIGYYATFTLYSNTSGFYASTQGCCRVATFVNVLPNQGYTYWCLIPPISQPDNNPDFWILQH